MFTLTFYGGAQTVTGSKHLVTLDNGKKVLLDCGMFQGKGNNDNYNRDFGFDASSINYLILSHAHIDHTGLVPRLVKQGFSGQIFCTPPTAELAALILKDSANIQNNEVDAIHDKRKEPLYQAQDVDQALNLLKTIPYNSSYEIDENLEVLFTDAGHILGSAVVNLTIKTKHRKKHLCFSGDIGRFDNRILNSPQPFPAADYIICESTYGDKLHDSLQNSEDKLKELIIETCITKKGKLLIPAFSIGRTQELIYSLNVLAEDGRLPDIPVFVDSPLAVYATDILKNNDENFNPAMKEYLKFDTDPFGFKNLHYITDKEESILIKELNEPCVIISSSGMMEGGRIRHHLKTCIQDPKNTILVTGYCEPSTLGGQISRGDKEVNIFGETHEVKADVQFLKEYSAHGDYGDMLKFLHCQDKEMLKYIFLVHGEIRVMEKFKNSLQKEGYQNIEIPGYMVSYSL
ncbi:MAG: MBL fold metallo-hydrolase [Opitutaceae bacterium]|nr:MBL fold metallo-hydrolase [Cytophagales bacterium]